MIIGYARVSTDDQRLDLQLAALKEAGCKNIFQDHGATGSHMDRPGLENVLRALKPGDTLVVWRLDRLGRSLTDLVKFVEELGRKGCEFRSLNESIDTRTSGGRLIFHIMAAFAEFERNLISERTRAGLVAARQRGSRLGRPRIVLTEAEINEARRAIKEKRQTLGEIAAGYQISSTTLRRRLDASAEGKRKLVRPLLRETKASHLPAPHKQMRNEMTGRTPHKVGPSRQS
ncbi:recombinase family protein (plasmid) [Paracoccus kondratievae]|uniref:recombinase family protein n=1 Tax=Paracoccus kondratievae TaxID=135740 RepID=UPI0012666696|nr:recombinase family protein [Paracoccus kondratievae]QFQ89748.1 recombinase family protein [Paracoccus kondratievae]